MMTPEQAMACLEAGACTVIGKGILSFFTLAVPIVASVLFALLILVMWKTPAMKYLIAIVTGKSLTYVTNRSQQGHFHTAAVSSEGMLEITRVGPALIAENSHTIERTSGRPLYFLFGEFASTVPPWWASALGTIKEAWSKKGQPINTSEDLGHVVGRRFNKATGAWEKTEMVVGEGPKTVEIRPYKTVNLHDMSNMFPYNITPALVESRSTHLIAKKLKFWQSMTPQFIITGALALVIMVIAAYLAYKFFGGGPDVNVITDSAGNLLGTTTENLQG